jgi:hypothetical protein
LVFLEVNSVKAGSHKSGVLTNSGFGGATGEFVDPWGSPYYIAYDTGYSNSVSINYSNSTVQVRKTVAVCNGPTWGDGVSSNKTARRFVNSWE